MANRVDQLGLVQNIQADQQPRLFGLQEKTEQARSLLRLPKQPHQALAELDGLSM